MLYFSTNTESIKLFIWKIEESTDEILFYLPSNLRETYKEEAERRFSGTARKLEWLTVRVLFHMAEGDENMIDYNQDGSPYIVKQKGNEPTYISISHTRGFAAIAISHTKRIGIDIEAFGTKIEKIVHRFSNKEEEPIEKLTKDEWRKYYIVLWSTKESVFKLCGKDKTPVVTGITVNPFQIETNGEVCSTVNEEKISVFYKLFPAFALTYTK